MKKKSRISRRDFVKLGGAVVAGTTFNFTSMGKIVPRSEEKPKIKQYRILGRTGFKVSDISSGGAWAKTNNVFRYAYDDGINYFDTAESYGKGESERQIGEAMQFMDRGKIFITTKLVIKKEDTEETILERFWKW